MKLADADSREDVIKVFDGPSDDYVKTSEGISRTRGPLVKSYMLETVPPTKQRPSLAELFRRAGHRIVPIGGEGTLFKVQSSSNKAFVGVIEQMLDRHPVYYTQETTKDSDPFVKRLVEANSDLDHLWISGRVFEELHQIVLKITPKHRFGKMEFRYAGIFEAEEPSVMASEDEETDDDASEGEERIDEFDGTLDTADSESFLAASLHKVHDG